MLYTHAATMVLTNTMYKCFQQNVASGAGNIRSDEERLSNRQTLLSEHQFPYYCNSSLWQLHCVCGNVVQFVGVLNHDNTFIPSLLYTRDSFLLVKILTDFIRLLHALC